MPVRIHRCTLGVTRFGVTALVHADFTQARKGSGFGLCIRVPVLGPWFASSGNRYRTGSCPHQKHIGGFRQGMVFRSLSAHARCPVRFSAWCDQLRESGDHDWLISGGSRKQDGQVLAELMLGPLVRFWLLGLRCTWGSHDTWLIQTSPIPTSQF